MSPTMPHCKGARAAALEATHKHCLRSPKQFNAYGFALIAGRYCQRFAGDILVDVAGNGDESGGPFMNYKVGGVFSV